MSAFRDRYGPWAFVAGASEGLGAAFAEQLAARGLDVALVARRADLLEALAADLSARHGVETRAIQLDLAAPDLPERLEVAVRGLEIGLVVYNAAATSIGPFLDETRENLERIVEVNCRGPLVVAHRLCRPMVERGRGGLVLMSSLTAFQGSPYLAVYGASKAYDMLLAEALWHELAPAGVDVVASCAGATRTPNYEASEPDTRLRAMEPAAVVTDALAALGRRPRSVPGAFNRSAAFLMGRLLPRRLAIRIMGNTTRDLYLERD